MSCNQCHKSGCACPVRQRGGKTASSREVATVTLHPKHNRFRVHVVVDATVTAGDVGVDIGVFDPESPLDRLWARAGSVAYSLNGGQLLGQLAPLGEHELRFTVTGYAGAGSITILVESWQESL